MATEDEKVIFSAEFEGQGVNAGVEDLMKNLDNLRAAQEELKSSIKETTVELKANQKQLDATARSAALALNPDRVKEYTQQANVLSQKNVELKNTLVDQAIALGKVKDAMKEAGKSADGASRSHDAFGKSLTKLTSLNHIAAEAVTTVRRHVSELALGLVSGLAGGIVATVLPSLAEFVVGMKEASEGLGDFRKEQAIAAEIQNKAVDGYSAGVAKLEIFRAKLNDTTISEAKRVELAKEYNKTADEGNKIDVTQINNLDEVNKLITQQIELIKKRALAKAAENVLSEKAEVLFKAQLDLEEQAPQFSDKEIEDITKRGQAAIDAQSKALGIKKSADVGELAALAGLPDDQLKKLAENNERFKVLLDAKTKNVLDNTFKQLNAIKEARSGNNALSGSNIASLQFFVDEAQKDFDRTLKIATQLTDIEGLIPFAKQKKEIENVFAQKLAELKARLAAVTVQTFQSEGLIREKFAKQLDKEFADIGKLLKEKKLTIPQSDILKGLLEQINQIELSKGLEEFRKKREDAIRKVDDEILALQIENGKARIVNIRDEFDKERAAIDENYSASIATIAQKQAAFLKQVDEDTAKGLISPAVANRKKFFAAVLFGGLLDKAEQARLNAELDLAFRKFQKMLEVARKPFEGDLLLDDEGESREISQLTALFLKGKIGYERYQKELTKISAQYSKVRKLDTLDELQDQLKLIEAKLSTTTDQKQVEQLTKQRDDLRRQIAKLNTDIDKGDADEQKRKTDGRINQLISYVNAVEQLASTVAQFWNQVNASEAAALDRSIALQEKRVANAQEIADKGNAEYLEMEQKRLDQLTQKREENARKQLAINNAVAASQAIVAAISAIAQAVETGSPLAAIAAVAAVIGAIGAAYNFVNSLEPQVANFYEGTEYVPGPGGRDKVKANLTQGERVVTAKDNAQYWDTLSAIHNHTVPAEVLNDFVHTYPNYNLPMVDFGRLAAATDGKLASRDPELLQRMDMLNNTMGLVVDGLSNVGIQFNLDEHGFEAAIGKARKQRKLRNRS